MSFDKIVEELIKKAQERGEFEDLPGKGKPIDLSAYFETPEDVRVAQSVLKNAGFASLEVDLLKEIAELKRILASTKDDGKKQDIRRQIEQKQIEFSLIMERQRRQRRQK
jgi:hypothetical protein